MDWLKIGDEIAVLTDDIKFIVIDRVQGWIDYMYCGRCKENHWHDAINDSYICRACGEVIKKG